MIKLTRTKENDMKIKTSELTGIQLDYAVDLIEGGYSDYLKRHTYAEAQAAQYRIHEPREPLAFRDLYGRPTCPKYSTCWLAMGPIIEREIHKIFKNISGTFTAQIRHEESHPLVAHKVLYRWSSGTGQTILIAAARCYVTSKLGDIVNVPEELV